MKDHPIIFSAPMVRALIQGRKTITRRLAWREKRTVIGGQIEEFILPDGGICWGRSGTQEVRTNIPTLWQDVKLGDRLWVKETWHAHKTLDQLKPREIGSGFGRYSIWHSADDEDKDEGGFRGRKRPSIFMPRWASRLTLVVTATKIEPVQEISDTDAIAEGICREPRAGMGFSWTVNINKKTCPGDTPKEAFASFWCFLNGAGQWETNPEVVTLTFAVHKRNIDAIEKAA
jgi:hypothetical protein